MPPIEIFFFPEIGSNIIRNFSSMWYQKKCQREANIPWRISTKEISDDVTNFLDPGLLA